jgi:hypothetical protein
MYGKDFGCLSIISITRRLARILPITLFRIYPTYTPHRIAKNLLTGDMLVLYDYLVIRYKKDCGRQPDLIQRLLIFIKL